jgi:post-segregation antitoxin (ccd killing protein)
MRIRDRMIAARLTADEEQLFRELARERGVTVSAQLREFALATAVRVRAAMKSRERKPEKIAA